MSWFAGDARSDSSTTKGVLPVNADLGLRTPLRQSVSELASAGHLAFVNPAAVWTGLVLGIVLSAIAILGANLFSSCDYIMYPEFPLHHFWNNDPGIGFNWPHFAGMPQP